jgi:hypothetical protein
VVLALPTRVQERDEILFKAIFPVVGIKRWHGCRKPLDAGQKETGRGRLNDKIQKAGHDLRHVEPSLRGPCEYAFHPRDGLAERGILSELVHAGIKAEELKHHPVEVVSAIDGRVPGRACQRVLDHVGPQSHEVLRRLRSTEPVRNPIPEEPLNPLVGGRTQVENGLPQRPTVFGGR